MLHTHVETVMVNLKALEEAIQKVENVRSYEVEFEANGLRIVLRALRPDEETVVQQWSQIAYEAGAEAGQAGLSDYLDRMRTAVLGFAIVELGDQDLRNVEVLETDEQDEKGNTISVPKHEAIRDLVATSWSRIMLTHVFSKYSELLRRVESHARDSVEFEPSDLDQEIERLEAELKELNQAKKEAAEGIELDAVTIQQQAAASVSDRHRELVKRRGEGQQAESQPTQPPPDASAQPQPPTPPQQPQARPQEPQMQPLSEPVQETAPPQPPRQAPEGGRQRAVPPSVPPPGREEYELESEADPRTEVPQGPPGPDLDNPDIQEPLGGDSFFDPSDPDAAVRAESERQAQLMRQHMERQRERGEAVRQRRELGLEDRPVHRPEATRPRATDLSTPPPSSPGGLRQASNTSDQVFNSGAGEIQTARPTRPTPVEMGGTQVYKMPTQTLEKPQHRRDARGNIIREAPQAHAPVSQRPGSNNPRFKGPPKG